MSCIESLIAPETFDNFISEYYEKKHYLSRSSERNRYQDIISSKEVFDFLHTYNLGYPKIALSKDGNKIAIDQYNKQVFNNRMQEYVSDVPAVINAFKSGATVALQGIQLWHKNVVALCNKLSSEMAIALNVNLYLSPVSSPGFSRHYDSHDSFIIQIEGSKTWKLFESPVSLPNSNIPQSNYDFSNAKHIETLVLNEGDVLYVPRGLVHEVSADTEQSLHLTIGFVQFTIFDALNALASDPDCAELRKTLSIYTDLRDAEKNYSDILSAVNSPKYRNKIEKILMFKKFKLIENSSFFPETNTANSNIFFYNSNAPFHTHHLDKKYYLYIANQVFTLDETLKKLFFKIKDQGQINIDDLPESGKETEFVNKLKLLGVLY